MYGFIKSQSWFNRFAKKTASVAGLDLEELEEKELNQIRKSYAKLAEHAREELKRGRSDTGVLEEPNKSDEG